MSISASPSASTMSSVFFYLAVVEAVFADAQSIHKEILAHPCFLVL
jgi:hypothetical protein